MESLHRLPSSFQGGPRTRRGAESSTRPACPRDQRGSRPRKAPLPDGADARRALEYSRSAPRRLQHDLARAGAARRRPLVTLEVDPRHAEVRARTSPAPGSPSGSTSASARRSRRCRARRQGRAGRSTSSSSTPTRRAARSISSGRCELTRPRQRHHRRQRRAPRRRDRRGQRWTRTSGDRGASTNSWRPNRGSAPRRSRRSAARATTASRSFW